MAEPKSAPVLSALPTLTEQAERLIALGVHRLAGLRATALRSLAEDSGKAPALLVVNPGLVPASVLAPLLRVNGKPGFVVGDMDDVDDFVPIDSVAVPQESAYVVSGLDRGDAMANWSPDEALPALVTAGRTPLTLAEGLHWVLQQPDILTRGRCFMTIGSRRPKADGTLDTRTPALWLSNGTGRDGAVWRNAAKVGWCWAGNRHTWLGFASAATRHALPRPR